MRTHSFVVTFVLSPVCYFSDWILRSWIARFLTSTVYATLRLAHSACLAFAICCVFAASISNDCIADETTSLSLSNFWRDRERTSHNIPSVAIDATVTYHDIDYGFLFLQDEEQTLYVPASLKAAIPAGTRIRMNASFTASTGQLNIDPESLSVISAPSALPYATPVARHEIPTLCYSSRMCRLVKSTVRAVHVEGWDTHTVITLDPGHQSFVALTIPVALSRSVAQTTAAWVGKDIDFQAVVGQAESSTGEVTGTSLYASSLDQISISKSQTRETTTTSNSHAKKDHTNLLGSVTLITRDGLYVQSPGVRAFVSTTCPLLVTEGKHVDILAEPTGCDFKLLTLRIHGDRRVKPLNANERRSIADLDSRLVTMTGAVESFEFVEDSIALLLTDGHRRAAAVVSGSPSELASCQIHSAAQVQITGVCSLRDSPHFTVPPGWTDKGVACSIVAGNVDGLKIADRQFAVTAHQWLWTLVIGAVLVSTLLGIVYSLRQNVRKKTNEATFLASHVDSLFASNPDAILVTTVSGGILSMNPAAKKLFEVTSAGGEASDNAEELFCRSFRILRQTFREAVQTVHTCGRFECELNSAVASCRHLHLVAVMMEIPGEQSCVLWVLRNVTKSVRLQEKLHLARKTQAMGQLASGLAHDFNNLLLGISGNLQIAALSKDLDSELCQRIADADKAARAASELVKRLLTLSVDSKFTEQSVSITTVFNNVRSLVSGMLPSQIQLRTSIPNPDIVLSADQTLIEQALVNLCINSMDAISNVGEIRLSAGYSRCVLNGQDLDCVVVRCSDTGAGMSDEILMQVFEPFYTTKESGRGTGMGLACTQTAIHQMGGVIEVDSTVGVGTDFRIILPTRSPSAEPSVEDNSGPSAVAAGGLRILVVDDEAHVRQVAVAALQQRGHFVVDTNTGENALGILNETGGDFDVVVLDYQMTGMSGSEVGDLVSRRWPHLKVIFCTGHAAHLSIRAPFQLIRKPYRVTDLQAAVAEAC